LPEGAPPPATANTDLEIGAGQGVDQHAIGVDRGVEQRLLAGLQLQDLVLDRVPGHEFVDHDRLGLTDAVRAIRGLRSTAGFHHGSRWIT
jgi:hypothetical protein